jgi:hypothetical protein
MSTIYRFYPPQGEFSVDEALCQLHEQYAAVLQGVKTLPLREQAILIDTILAMTKNACAIAIATGATPSLTKSPTEPHVLALQAQPAYEQRDFKA